MTEIITIGDEILIGQITDTNSAWMAVELNKIGINVSKITTVLDSHAEIKAALAAALQKSDVVLITGGLGPTKDDVTKHALCQFFETDLIYDDAVSRNIEDLFRSRPLVLNGLTKAQAMVPEACEVIQNKVGTAPIMWFEKDDKIVVSMPGVPFEMKRTMTDDVLPRLKERFNSNVVINQTVQVYGHGESALAILIATWENELPEFLKLAYLPSFGLVKLRLSGKLKDRKRLQDEIDRQFEALRSILGDSIIAENDLALEENLGILLRNKKLTVSVAESCTGGNIASKITAISGSSDYFIGSVTAYQNRIKVDLLGVREDDIKANGAVSEVVVEQMADGVRKLLCSDVAIATSGIAGPSGGTADKPVGTVWIAVSTPTKTIRNKFSFGNYSRENIIERSTTAALIMLIEVIR